MRALSSGSHCVVAKILSQTWCDGVQQWLILWFPVSYINKLLPLISLHQLDYLSAQEQTVRIFVLLKVYKTLSHKTYICIYALIYLNHYKLLNTY